MSVPNVALLFTHEMLDNFHEIPVLSISKILKIN